MDKHIVYRPLLDLIGHTEGTDKGRGYNETLGYGAFTGGDVSLVGMSLREVDALQTKMLKHPNNNWNSSAIGRYQIVRTTLRKIRKALLMSLDTKFDEATQDQMACYLLYYRGIDDFIAGKISKQKMLTNLSKEWASIPKPDGNGYYSNQKKTPVTPQRVYLVLDQVKVAASKPKQTPSAPVVKKEQPVNPKAVGSPTPPKKKTLLDWVLSLFGVGK